MTDRDRLIELVESSVYGNIDEGFYGPVLNCENVADYLLANGVIVPPCNVGDMVYKISRNKVKECEVVFIGISADEKCSYFNFVENYTDGTFYRSYSMVFDVIGKTVFLTKEEAEEKLRGLQNEL